MKYESECLTVFESRKSKFEWNSMFLRGMSKYQLYISAYAVVFDRQQPMIMVGWELDSVKRDGVTKYYFDP